MLLRFCVFVVVFVILGSVRAAAQEASIAGTAVDESKAVLTGVTVTASDLASGRVFVGVTNEHGAYHLIGLPPGRYRVKAELPGFTAATIAEEELLVGQNATIVFTLKVASLGETVVVRGEPPLVNTRSAEVAGNVDPRQMEQLPIQGRNWMELAMMVKGITANDVANNMPGVVRDTQFELNLDGQQITQKVAHTSLFGQPAISREAIAQYQIVTNLFDITMGRSNGIQVQAVSRSGTNTMAGSFLGNFRDSRFNASDFIAKRVLPYSNQQVAATFGAPIVKDKLLYFLSYEHEREPSTLVISPPALASQQISLATETAQHTALDRIDYQLGGHDHLMVRTMYFRRHNPFEEVAGTDYPTRGSDRTRDSNVTSANWSRVLGSRLVQEVKAGYYHYHWNYAPAAGVPLTPEYIFGRGALTIGARWPYPENSVQDEASVRYDLTWQKGMHDLKFGGEFIKARTSGWWRATERGQLLFSAVPSDVGRRFPLDAWNNSSRWDLTGLDQLATSFNQSYAEDWSDNIPRPMYGVWIGDTWALKKTLTLTIGLRYDLDWRATSPPGINETTILINNGRDPVQDVGYRNDIHDGDNVAPRVGFVWNVSGSNDLVIRGGSGIFYSVLDSEAAFRAQLFNGQHFITNSYLNDGQPGFVLDPTRGVSAADVLSGHVRLTPQAVTVIGHDFQTPYTWQSSLGFQKQLDPVMVLDADLVFWHAYDEGSGRDPNLFYDPATGFNKNPNLGRPNPAYGPITLYESQGKADYLGLASSFTRRYRNNFQAGVTYTLMFFKHDNGTADSGTGGFANNPFDRGAEWARATDSQRHTLRANGIYQLPWGVSLAGAFFFGSGNYFSARAGVDPYNTGNSNVSRVRPNFSIIPRNNFKGQPLQKLDLRFSKEFPVGRVKLAGIAEVFNVYNHPNYGSYNLLESSSTYGQPVQNLATSYLPRVWQLAFRVSF